MHLLHYVLHFKIYMRTTSVLKTILNAKDILVALLLHASGRVGPIRRPNPANTPPRPLSTWLAAATKFFESTD